MALDVPVKLVVSHFTMANLYAAKASLSLKQLHGICFFKKFKINGWKLIESRILLLNVLAMKYISEIPIVGQLWKWFSFQLCPKFLLAQAGKTMLIIKIIDFFLKDNISVIKNNFSFFFKLNLFKIGIFVFWFRVSGIKPRCSMNQPLVFSPHLQQPSRGLKKLNVGL